MDIGFLIPSLATEGHAWYLELPWPMQGAPVLSGFLRRHGFPDIRHYDFDHHVLGAFRDRPLSVDLAPFDDEAEVSRLLQDGQTELTGLAVRLLDLLGVGRHRLYALSLASVVGMEPEIRRGMRIAMCLASVLKRRFPESITIVGGLQASPDSLHAGLYREMLTRCPALDYAGIGAGQPLLYGLCRCLEQGLPPPDGLPEGIVFRACGAGGLLEYAGLSGPAAASPAGRNESRVCFDLFPVADDGAADPSIPASAPWFDPHNLTGFSISGAEIADRYAIPERFRPELASAAETDFLVLPARFLQGCPFRCAFCAHAGTKLFSMAPEQAVRVVRHLRDTTGCRHFIFFNTNFNTTYRYADELLDRLIAERIDSLWQDSFNLRRMDRALAEKMAAAGVVRAVVGVEYPTARMLAYIGKGIDLDTLNRNLEHLHRAGIWIHALLIPGMPTETEADLRELVAWIHATRGLVDAYNISPYYMVAGSPMWRDPHAFGLELPPERDGIQGGIPFSETGGPGWEEKRRRIAASAEAVREAIVAAKGSGRYTASNLDLHLLMYLYRALGHQQKEQIRRIYEASAVRHPHLVRALPELERGLSASPPGGILPAGLQLAGPPCLSGAEIRFGVRSDGRQTGFRLRPRDRFSYLKGEADDRGRRLDGRLFSLQWQSGGPEAGLVLAGRLAAHPVVAAYAASKGWRLAPVGGAGQAAAFDLRLPDGEVVRLELSAGGGTDGELARAGRVGVRRTAGPDAGEHLRRLARLIARTAVRLSEGEPVAALAAAALALSEAWATGEGGE